MSLLAAGSSSCRPAPAWRLQDTCLSSPAAPMCLELCCGEQNGNRGFWSQAHCLLAAGVAGLQNNHQVTWGRCSLQAHCVCQPLREERLLTQPGWHQRCLRWLYPGDLGGCPAPLPAALQTLRACCGDCECTMMCQG